MTPAQIKAISQNTGLSWREMARICRVNESTIRKAAAGVYPLSGPCAMILDMLDRGELPDRFYSTRHPTRPFSKPTASRLRWTGT